MKYLANVTELRSYLIEIEAENTEKANDIVCAEIDKGISRPTCQKENVIVEFKKQTKGAWSER